MQPEGDLQEPHWSCTLSSHLVSPRPLGMVLIGMCGIELYELIQGISDTLASRVVFVTGDTVNSGTRDFIAKTGNPVVAKPFSVEDLLSSIQMVEFHQHPVQTGSLLILS